MSSTQPTTSPTFAPTPTTAVVNDSPLATLGKDDFLKLLVTQMQDQDPTNPTDSSQFMSQLAQFSSLEQQTNISESIDGLASTTAVNQAVDLIGRNVTFDRADGSSGSGVAQSVAISGTDVVISVGSENVSLSQITAVGQSSSGQASGSSQAAVNQSTSTTTNP